MMFIFVLIGMVILGIIATILTETENFGWATLSLIISVITAQLLHVVDLLGWVSAHGVLTILYALAYVGVGIVWSFVKWFSFLISYRDKYREYKSQFLANKKLDDEGHVPMELREDFTRFLSNRCDYNHRSVFANLSLGERPKAADNKRRIVAWMSLWPCSVIGTLLNDPVRKLFNFLFNYFKSLYQKMSDAVFKNDVELK
jgi:hypothetical protein